MIVILVIRMIPDLKSGRLVGPAAFLTPDGNNSPKKVILWASDKTIPWQELWHWQGGSRLPVVQVNAMIVLVLLVELKTLHRLLVKDPTLNDLERGSK